MNAGAGMAAARLRSASRIERRAELRLSLHLRSEANTLAPGSVTEPRSGVLGGRVEQPLPAERHRAIRQLLKERQVVRVSKLSELLGVSEVTIRRDLEDLEQQGVLERT